MISGAWKECCVREGRRPSWGRVDGNDQRVHGNIRIPCWTPFLCTINICPDKITNISGQLVLQRIFQIVTGLIMCLPSDVTGFSWLVQFISLISDFVFVTWHMTSTIWQVCKHSLNSHLLRDLALRHGAYLWMAGAGCWGRGGGHCYIIFQGVFLQTTCLLIFKCFLCRRCVFKKILTGLYWWLLILFRTLLCSS